MNALALSLIQQYHLNAHPEGGYFKETIAAKEAIQPPNRIARPLFTSILFMLHDQEISHFHRLESDELWIFQKGDPLDVVCINPSGDLKVIHLGYGENDVLQANVPSGTLFASYVPSEGVSLVACIVAPGFLYSEFEMPSKDALLSLYPQNRKWIEQLSYNKDIK